MARITDDELEQLKREVSLERLVASRGIKLARHGKDLLGLCPFHADREPSLVVSPATNLWHCLGACQSGGSVIDWVMKAEGVSFRHAVELLRADAPSLARDGRANSGPQQGPVPKRTSACKLAGGFEPDVDDEALMKRVVAFYHRTLQQSAEAQAYLEERGLGGRELSEHFELGYANRSLGYRLPDKTRKEGAAIRGRLQALGVYRQSGHEHLAGSLVVPVINDSGKVVQLYGRKLCDRLRKGTPKHLYLPGPRRGVFNEAALGERSEVILCESLLDALSFWRAGYRHVTASYGVEGFTAEHLTVFEHLGIQRVLIAYDRDAAGDRAADKLAGELAEQGMAVFRVLFPKGMDANEYALKVTPAHQSLGLALKRAEWLAGKSAQVATPAEVSPPLAAAAPPPQPPSTSKAGPPPSRRDEVVLSYGDRRWRIRGLGRNTAEASLKVNVLVGHEDGSFHVDTLELYSARQRAVFIQMAASELGLDERVVKKELGQVLLHLEEQQEAKRRAAERKELQKIELSEADREAALELLRDPKLVERLAADLERCGLVGERENKLIGYLGAVSRKLDEPLAIVIQSSSAAGKSSLMDAVLALVPPEDRVQYSAMTGQSLFYMSEQDLVHKVLAIVEEEGAERASYALKLLQSEGELTIASTGKDPVTGRLVTQDYRVEGPVMIMLTTTAIEIDEELLNRCVVLTVDEGREQTRAIHARQRAAQTLSGMLQKREREHVRRLHHNAQRLLEPLMVVNPLADSLRFADHKTRTRRDHMKYLTVIRTIALLHQHQRPVETVEHRGETVRYIEVQQSDIELAEQLCGEVLGRGLDELPPQTRRLLGLLGEMATELGKREGVAPTDVRFTRRQVREHTGWSPTPLKIHLGRLEELEYLHVMSGGPRRRFVYQLGYDANWSGPSSNWSGSGLGLVRPPTGPDKRNGRRALGDLVRLGEVHVSGPRAASSHRSDTSPKSAAADPVRVSS